MKRNKWMNEIKNEIKERWSNTLYIYTPHNNDTPVYDQPLRTSKPWAVAKRLRHAVHPYDPTPSGLSGRLGEQMTPEKCLHDTNEQTNRKRIFWLPSVTSWKQVFVMLPPVTMRSIAISMYACRSARSQMHVYQKSRDNFAKFSVHVAWDHGSVWLGRICKIFVLPVLHIMTIYGQQKDLCSKSFTRRSKVWCLWLPCFISKSQYGSRRQCQLSL